MIKQMATERTWKKRKLKGSWGVVKRSKSEW